MIDYDGLELNYISVHGHRLGVLVLDGTSNPIYHSVRCTDTWFYHFPSINTRAGISILVH